MKKSAMLGAILFGMMFFVGCSYRPFAGILSEDGTDFSSAIVVQQRSEFAGVVWEYEWLEGHACEENGGYKKSLGQDLLSEDEHWYDGITALCNDGTEREYFFLIDSYFGKY